MLHINSIVWCQLVLTVPSQIMQPIKGSLESMFFLVCLKFSIDLWRHVCWGGRGDGTQVQAYSCSHLMKAYCEFLYTWLSMSSIFLPKLFKRPFLTLFTSVSLLLACSPCETHEIFFRRSGYKTPASSLRTTHTHDCGMQTCALFIYS